MWLGKIGDAIAQPCVAGWGKWVELTEGYKNRTSPGSLGTGGRTILEKGGYLLSHVRSTIGVAKLNFSVRNGKRWDLRAITTLISFLVSFPVFIQDTVAHIHKNQQYHLQVRKSRAISNARL